MFLGAKFKKLMGYGTSLSKLMGSAEPIEPTLTGHLSNIVQGPPYVFTAILLVLYSFLIISFRIIYQKFAFLYFVLSTVANKITLCFGNLPKPCHSLPSWLQIKGDWRFPNWFLQLDRLQSCLEVRPLS